MRGRLLMKQGRSKTEKKRKEANDEREKNGKNEEK